MSEIDYAAILEKLGQINDIIEVTRENYKLKYENQRLLHEIHRLEEAVRNKNAEITKEIQMYNELSTAHTKIVMEFTQIENGYKLLLQKWFFLCDKCMETLNSPPAIK